MEEGKLTMRHFQSGSLISPGVWRMEKSACPEVLGCMLNSFPISGVNTNTFCTKGSLITVVKHEMSNQGQTFRSASKV